MSKYFVPRLLAMYRSGEYGIPVAWALAHSSGCLVTATLDTPSSVTLWPTPEQAEETLGAYVHYGDRSDVGSRNTTSAAGGGEQVG